MKIKSEEIKKYISSSLKAIKEGVQGGGGSIIGPIEFDLAVTNIKEKEGGIKIYITEAKGKLKSEEINRIKIKVGLSIENKNNFLSVNKNKKSWNQYE
jgi:hypothetical protein